MAFRRGAAAKRWSPAGPLGLQRRLWEVCVLQSAMRGSLHLAPLDAVPELNGTLEGTSMGATPKRVLHVGPMGGIPGRELPGPQLVPWWG